MDVTWHIEPTAAGCDVRIEHDFAPRLPGLGRIVDRWFTRPIAGRTLAAFKAIAEAVAVAEAARTAPAARSAPDPELNVAPAGAPR